jgi:uncharacterized protein HemY
MASELAELAVIAGIVVLAILLLRSFRKRHGPQTRKRSFWKSRRARNYRPWDQEAELLKLCHGDHDLAERLIGHELERSPNLSRAGAALAAATRLKHDQS